LNPQNLSRLAGGKPEPAQFNQWQVGEEARIPPTRHLLIFIIKNQIVI
jgi:hypothetical protein